MKSTCFTQEEINLSKVALFKAMNKIVKVIKNESLIQEWLKKAIWKVYRGGELDEELCAKEYDNIYILFPRIIKKYLFRNEEGNYNGTKYFHFEKENCCEIIEAMNDIMIHLSDEDDMYIWLRDGVPDGTVTLEDIKEYYSDITEKEFNELVSLFLNIMYFTCKSGYAMWVYFGQDLTPSK